MDIHFLDDELEKFIRGLEKPAIAKVLRTLDLLETFGNKLGMPHCKPLRDGLFELRIRGAQEVRIFYSFHRSHIVLLCGFVKKAQQTPIKYFILARKKKNQLDGI